jgi:hypothetical protein
MSTDLMDTMVTMEELAYRAYDMRVKGHTWTDIAVELGYSSPVDAHRKVTLLIKSAGVALNEERKEEIIQLELDRLDALQVAFYPTALAGDYKSAETVLKIMSHRAKLLQLGEERVETTRTVIVTDQNYLQILKEIAE